MRICKSCSSLLMAGVFNILAYQANKRIDVPTMSCGTSCNTLTSPNPMYTLKFCSANPMTIHRMDAPIPKQIIICFLPINEFTMPKTNAPKMLPMKRSVAEKEGIIKFVYIFTCSDLRSCQVYGSKSMAVGVRPSVRPLLVQPYIIFACMVFCGYLDIWTADVNFGKMII